MGISPDSEASHQKFIAKNKIPFPLLCDPEKKVMTAYGAFGQKKMYGKESLGVERSTFLIDKEGVLRREWRKVKVKGHADEVLAAVQEIA